MSETKILYRALADSGIDEGHAERIAEAVLAIRNVPTEKEADDMAGLQRDIAEVKKDISEIRNDIAGARVEIAGARVETKDDFTEVRKEIHETQRKMADLRTELKDGINKSANTLRNWGFGFVGLVIAAIKFL